MNPRYPSIAKRASFRCEYCHAPERVFNFAFEVEHILPRALGGDDEATNLALACESCNLFKGAATQGWDDQTEAFVDLFHPRRDVWEDHFRWDADENLIMGLTSTGRATVGRLKLNSEFQIRARAQWATLNLYP